jgi:hypothetical protein
MKRKALVPIILVIVLCATAQEKPRERINVYLSGRCNDNLTGALVESSLRESIRASSGYTLVDVQEPGSFMISLACVDAGQEGEGWTAVAYDYGLLLKANPENLGTSLWHPTLGVFTVGRAHAQNKGQELFARFDNDLHHH